MIEECEKRTALKEVRIQAVYPTVEHEQASKAIVGFFSEIRDIDAVILMGSCARGKATPDSCLDIMVLVLPDVFIKSKTSLEQKWDTYYKSEKVFKTLRKVGRYSHIDLEFIDGCFKPGYHGWCTGPDEFELEIGNTLVYSVPLWQQGSRLNRLKSEWLPYYNKKLRKERLAMVLTYCKNNLDHIPLYIKRGLYFQAFDRLYNAFGEFLQALFISKKVYPLAYDKWIREQIEDILGLPFLYAQLVHLLEIRNFQSDEIAKKADELHSLLIEHIDK